jgi:hypothetical protein
MNRIGRWLLLLTLALTGAAASAHEMSMAEMEMHEQAPGQFVWQWAAGERPAEQYLKPVWPEGCVGDAHEVRCGEGGLKGELSVDGVGQKFSAAIVKITWLDGQLRAYTLTGGQPTVHLYGTADDQRGMGEVTSAYIVLGIRHILTGTDHMLFVIGLLFLVGFHKRLVVTITAFTVAHSLTLGSSALGWLTLRSAPVEASIALSIMLVAGEALRDRETLARRLPALVAFLFGLVHGLGFAGALKAIGLPEQHFLLALLTFNVGVEIGQLLIVAAAWLVYRTLRQFPVMPQARLASLYAIGTMAAYWSASRIFGILTS